MHAVLDDNDVERITDRLVEKLKPYLAMQASTDSKEHELMSVKEAAEFLGVNRSWVYKAVSLKQIPHIKVGKYPKFKRTTLNKWLDSQQRKPFSN